MLRELREGYGLTAKDARTDNNEALKRAAEVGHIYVLRELKKGYGLTIDDVAEPYKKYKVVRKIWSYDF